MCPEWPVSDYTLVVTAVFTIRGKSPFIKLSSKTTLTPTNPSSLFPWQQLCPGHLYNVVPVPLLSLFISLEKVSWTVTQWIHMSLRRSVSNVKNVIFLHTSVVLSSHGWQGQEMGMNASCLGPALKADCKGRWHNGAMFLCFHQTLWNVWFTVFPCCFNCDLELQSDGYLLLYMCAQVPKGPKWKTVTKTKLLKLSSRTLHKVQLLCFYVQSIYKKISKHTIT